MRLTASWGGVGVEGGSSRQKEAVPVGCRKKPQEGSVTLWVLTQACWGKLGQGMPGEGGKIQGNTLDSSRGIKDLGCAWYKAVIYVSHHHFREE